MTPQFLSNFIMNVHMTIVHTTVDISTAIIDCLLVRHNLDVVTLDKLNMATRAHLTRLFLNPWTKNIIELVKLMHSTTLTQAAARASSKL